MLLFATSWQIECYVKIILILEIEIKKKKTQGFNQVDEQNPFYKNNTTELI